ncbi:hypothetical protein [Pseudonocardia sp. N23]|uniref:hypothetical protein n=1 Tax=Pseudonocardia sp. N23 TaxID=1987376 RepID=UPI000BFE1A0B|nr:hypothetical protein [Pseudonocardia sp. N23]GAY12991.1 hypothetical protein TOK_1544 [Pseudonocardia sp. N23]
MDSHEALDVARTRWRAAEERLYPTLIADPAAGARAVDAIRQLLVELRRHGSDLAGLLATAADPRALVAPLSLPCNEFPVEMLVGVACGARLREIVADQDHRRIEQLIARGVAAGATWVVLDGPDDPDALTEGRHVIVHVTSRTVLTATVDPWTDDQPYELHVLPSAGDPLARRFGDRAEWLDEFRLCRRDVETLHGDPDRTGATRTGAR